MATAVYVVLDLETRVLEAVTAGHPPVLFVPPGSPPHYLELEANVPLGVLSSPSYQSTKVELDPGSLLVFFTDGLVETARLPLQDGLTRLAAVVEELVAGGAEVAGLSRRIIEAMVPEPSQDDIALLTVRVD